LNFKSFSQSQEQRFLTVGERKLGKVKIFLDQREVAFLSLSKICENLNFSNVLGDKNAINLCSKIISTLPKYHSYFCSKQQTFSTRKLKLKPK
jgi:hypothetical protein